MMPDAVSDAPFGGVLRGVLRRPWRRHRRRWSGSSPDGGVDVGIGHRGVLLLRAVMVARTAAIGHPGRRSRARCLRGAIRGRRRPTTARPRRRRGARPGPVPRRTTLNRQRSARRAMYAGAGPATVVSLPRSVARARRRSAIASPSRSAAARSVSPTVSLTSRPNGGEPNRRAARARRRGTPRHRRSRRRRSPDGRAGRSGGSRVPGRSPRPARPTAWLRSWNVRSAARSSGRFSATSDETTPTSVTDGDVEALGRRGWCRRGRRAAVREGVDDPLRGARAARRRPGRAGRRAAPGSARGPRARARSVPPPR